MSSAAVPTGACGVLVPATFLESAIYLFFFFSYLSNKIILYNTYITHKRVYTIMNVIDKKKLVSAE